MYYTVLGCMYTFGVGFCIVACLWQVRQCETPETAGQVTETRLPRFWFMYVSNQHFIQQVVNE